MEDVKKDKELEVVNGGIEIIHEVPVGIPELPEELDEIICDNYELDYIMAPHEAEQHDHRKPSCAYCEHLISLEHRAHYCDCIKNMRKA